MTYLPVLLLLGVAAWIPVAIGILSLDLWRHELVHYAASTRLAILATIIEVAGLSLFAIYLLSQGRFL